MLCRRPIRLSRRAEMIRNLPWASCLANACPGRSWRQPCCRVSSVRRCVASSLEGGMFAWAVLPRGVQALRAEGRIAARQVQEASEGTLRNPQFSRGVGFGMTIAKQMKCMLTRSRQGRANDGHLISGVNALFARSTCLQKIRRQRALPPAAAFLVEMLAMGIVHLAFRDSSEECGKGVARGEAAWRGNGAKKTHQTSWTMSAGSRTGRRRG